MNDFGVLRTNDKTDIVTNSAILKSGAQGVLI